MFASARIVGRRLAARAANTRSFSTQRTFSSAAQRRVATGLVAGVTVGTAAALLFQANTALAEPQPMFASKSELAALKARLDANDIDAACATHQAFVFIKPHAVTPKVKALLEEELVKMGITITGQGEIDAATIDKDMLIDTHYGAIANRAVKQKPTELVVTERAQADFEKAFGFSWKDALAKGVVYNAMDAAKKLGVSGSELGKRYDTLKKGVTMIKFGGGFYVGKMADDMYVVNGFYMSMREKYTAPGTSIYYFTVEFPANNLSWKDFRENKLGATDPTAAAEGSLRRQIYNNWRRLGLPGQPNTGDNGVHASASPYEALAERMNWLGVAPERDTYGKGLIAAGVPAASIVAWSSDPQVKGASIFDQLEDLDGKACLEKAAKLA